jgi:HD-like signal output (HDOD) protein
VHAATSGRLRLPMVPRVVTNLIIQLRSPTASMNDVASELERDPILAARVLRMANSPFFCGRRSVVSISEAVSIVGTDALKTLVVSCGISGIFVDVPSVNLPVFWHDSTLAAHAARELARLTGIDANAAFLCGLLHRTGHLILCQSLPEAAAPFMALAKPLRAEELEQMELRQFGESHRAVGAGWLDSLSLPVDVVAGVRGYLDPVEASSPPSAVLLRMAGELAAAVSAGKDAQAAAQDLPAPCVEFFGMTDLLESAGFVTACDRLSKSTQVW